MKVCVSCYSFQIHGHFKSIGTILPTPCPCRHLKTPLSSDLVLPTHLHQRPACCSPDLFARLPGQTAFLSFVVRVTLGLSSTQGNMAAAGAALCSLSRCLPASQMHRTQPRAPGPRTAPSSGNVLVIWAMCTLTFSKRGF